MTSSGNFFYFWRPSCDKKLHATTRHAICVRPKLPHIATSRCNIFGNVPMGFALSPCPLAHKEEITCCRGHFAISCHSCFLCCRAVDATAIFIEVLCSKICDDLLLFCTNLLFSAAFGRHSPLIATQNLVTPSIHFECANVGGHNLLIAMLHLAAPTIHFKLILCCQRAHLFILCHGLIHFQPHACPLAAANMPLMGAPCVYSFVTTAMSACHRQFCRWVGFQLLPLPDQIIFCCG